MKKVSFLGAGSWGTALAIVCANNGHQVTLWSKVQSEIDMLREHREHMERLPGVKLPDSIVIEDDLEKACDDQDIIVFSVASPYVRTTAREAKDFVKDQQIIVNVGKGIEESTSMTLCEVIKDELPQADVCVLSCRGSFQRNPYDRCCWCQDREDRIVCSGCFHGQKFPCIYQPGYGWY